MAAPRDGAQALVSLTKGDDFALLNSTRGWAWGYAAEGRVGYVPASAIGA